MLGKTQQIENGSRESLESHIYIRRSTLITKRNLHEFAGSVAVSLAFSMKLAAATLGFTSVCAGASYALKSEAFNTFRAVAESAAIVLGGSAAGLVACGFAVVHTEEEEESVIEDDWMDLRPNPKACLGCKHFNGMRANKTLFCCAMHPSGPGDVADSSMWIENCPDWDGKPQTYKFVRIQGHSDCLYLVRESGEGSLPLFNGAVGLSPTAAKLLLRRFNVLSVNQLVGCRFDSMAQSETGAFSEIMRQTHTEARYDV